MTTWDYRPAMQALIHKKGWSRDHAAAVLDCNRLALECWLDGEANEDIDRKARAFLLPQRTTAKETTRMGTMPPGFEIIAPCPEIWIKIMPSGKISFSASADVKGKPLQFGINGSRLFFRVADNEKADAAVTVNTTGQLTFPQLVAALRSRGAEDGVRYAGVPEHGGWMVTLPGPA